jgi:hypothetical protein
MRWGDSKLDAFTSVASPSQLQFAMASVFLVTAIWTMVYRQNLLNLSPESLKAQGKRELIQQPFQTVQLRSEFAQKAKQFSAQSLPHSPHN